MTQVLRPLTLGELLDRTFSLYRRHLLVFIGVVALPNLLAVAANIVNTSLLVRGNVDLARVLISGGTAVALALASMVTMAISQAATMIVVSRLHLGQPVTITDAFAGLKGRVFQLCVITITLAILELFGVLLLIVPGIFFALRWSLAIPSAVLERLGLRRAMGRSAALVEGQYGRIFAIFVLYFLLAVAFLMAVQVPIIVVVLTRGGSITDMPLWAQITRDVGQFFTQCLIGPLLHIAIALAYYDSRVRKEAFDIEHMLAQLGPAEPQPPVSAVTV